jgi:hypothetical protein
MYENLTVTKEEIRETIEYNYYGRKYKKKIVSVV